MRKSNSYLNTFQNTPNGVRKYMRMVKDIRKFVKGGRFVKMFRGGVDRRSGSFRNDCPRFDVYLLGKTYADKIKFFQFQVSPHERVVYVATNSRLILDKRRRSH